VLTLQFVEVKYETHTEATEEHGTNFEEKALGTRLININKQLVPRAFSLSLKDSRERL